MAIPVGLVKIANFSFVFFGFSIFIVMFAS
nr:MAG TPA: hypothetical protein [Microviridae sp.]